MSLFPDSDKNFVVLTKGTLLEMILRFQNQPWYLCVFVVQKSFIPLSHKDTKQIKILNRHHLVKKKLYRHHAKHQNQ